mmetsp:Transcript_40186/g.79219  ORF Transcript_40186/g.79219 Transcript_40186/m.79219 type:complete len:95 (+) Transcript_40186:1766-2050(+)
MNAGGEGDEDLIYTPPRTTYLSAFLNEKKRKGKEEGSSNKPSFIHTTLVLSSVSYLFSPPFSTTRDGGQRERTAVCLTSLLASFLPSILIVTLS